MMYENILKIKNRTPTDHPSNCPTVGGFVVYEVAIMRGRLQTLYDSHIPKSFMIIGALPFVHVRRYFALKVLLLRPLFFGMLSCKGDHVASRPFLNGRSYTLSVEKIPVVLRPVI